MLGKTISHYRIEASLGKGGMGEVYLAQDTTLDRKVALKFLAEALQQVEHAVDLLPDLVRASRSVAALGHGSSWVRFRGRGGH